MRQSIYINDKDKLLVLLWPSTSNIQYFHDFPQNIFSLTRSAMRLHENIILCGWFTHQFFLHKSQRTINVVSVITK